MRLLTCAVLTLAAARRGSIETPLLRHESPNATVPLLAQVRNPDETQDWIKQVQDSPVNDAMHSLGFDGLDRPSDVMKWTCFTLLTLLALVLFGGWYHLPDGGTVYGWSTRSVKIGLLLFTWWVSGTVVMMLIEGYTLGTSVYIMAQIVTTVGYGDFCPSVWYTQLFMSFYVILCILVIAGVVSSIADDVMSSFDKKLKQNVTTCSQTPRGIDPERQDYRYIYGQRFYEVWTKYSDIFIAAGLFWGMVFLGTWYYGYLEGCTCSYGKTKIDGCSEETQEMCRATGGNDKTYMEAFYMSCITLTTVGFGDYTPMSQHGRIFGAAWMLLGVAATGNFVRAFSEVFMMEAQKSREVDVQKCFHIIDKNGDGSLDRFEFVSFILLEHGLVTKEMLDDINEQYDVLDYKKTGEVTLQMILDHETGGKVNIGKKLEPQAAGGASHLLRKATQAAQSAGQ